MLAVNGSVEAARAGEFGKGFAVVSTDIRNLARDCAENADRIKDTVKAIQDRSASCGATSARSPRPPSPKWRRTGGSPPISKASPAT